MGRMKSTELLILGPVIIVWCCCPGVQAEKTRPRKTSVVLQVPGNNGARGKGNLAGGVAMSPKRHNRAQILRQRIRYIARRLSLIRWVWRMPEYDDKWKRENAGCLSK